MIFPKAAFIPGLAFCIGLAFAAPGESHPKVDPAFWGLKLKTLDGDSIPMGTLKGKYLLLNFWGEWCAKCQEELPFLVRQELKYSGNGLRIVGFLKAAIRRRRKGCSRRRARIGPRSN